MARNREFSDWFEIDDGGHQRDVFVTFTISPVVPATYWQPAEGGEIELLSADPEGCCDIIDSLSEATLDGIVLGGVIADDSDRVLVSVTHTIEYDTGVTETRYTFEDAS